MATDRRLTVLTLPATTLANAPQPAVRDAVTYFDPDLVAVPGPPDPRAAAAARDAAAPRPVLHPQLGDGDRIEQFRYVDGDVKRSPDAARSPDTVDVLAVGRREALPELRAELAATDRQTGPEAATYVFVPRLTVEWDATALAADLPSADHLAGVSATLPEPVTVLAGGQPAEYYHEWSLTRDGAAVSVPVAGLGASDRDGARFTRHTCTARGSVAADAVDADTFGLGALQGVGAATADRLRRRGCRTPADVRDVAVSDLVDLPGVGRATAERMHAHADVIDSGDPIVTTNERPVERRDGRPPLCLDVETDGLSPTIIWQFGVYDPETDDHRAFVEKRDPTDPERVLDAFVTWLLANHNDRTVLTWNGYRFDYRHVEAFLRRYCPEYVDAWAEMWTADLYAWAVRDGNALLPGRTNRLDHVARALGYERAETGLTGARTAAAYQEFMRAPEDPAAEPDWDRHEAYCEADCRALWHVYRSIADARRRDATDSGTGGASGRQAGLTDFHQ